MAKNKNGNGSFDYGEEYEYDINDENEKRERSRAGASPGKDGARAERSETDDATAGEMTRKRAKNPSSIGVQITTAVIFVVAVFLIICFIFAGGTKSGAVGALGGFVGGALLGTLGGAAVLIPLFLVNGALHLKRDISAGRVAQKIIFSALSILIVSVIVHAVFCIFAKNGSLVVTKGTGALFDGYTFADGIKQLYASGTVFVGGGALGGLVCVLLVAAVGIPGTLLFSSLFLAICLMFVLGTTPAAIWKRMKFYIIRNSEKRADTSRRQKKDKAEKAEKRKNKTENFQYGHTYRQYDNYASHSTVVNGVKRGPGETFDERPNGDRERKMSNIDSFAFTDSTELVVYDETLAPANSRSGRAANLSEIFDNPVDDGIRESFERASPQDAFDTEASVDMATLNVRRAQASPKRADGAPPPEKKKEPSKPSYIFPPVELLGYKPPLDEGNIEVELRTKAQKLVETLENFNIRTKVVNISRGPAVTRYEIAPEAGTKVSAIVNRVDDISLGLASSVLIEGVIPGKSAIGIEVPNKNVSTVYLRELIDDAYFRDAKSRLTASLGIDITGSKVYLDIAKMPHLLIAGATGMGKSVCINSLLVSLLYKSTPDEVKFILVDPKKVEFNIYDGLPHLLVPVVSDPKKAAGALNWCVTEMERRYDILESKNKRNLAQYNEAAANDPEAEKLPQIVIVIDELADLMLTAKDVVETSISRIAAKARAAGMHLIIGTQRPSVDVITGTIKANIPSRIACTVSSQTDSRTILDGAGAEKLVGRGDMLYSPVGARMPLRVQGAFVDEREIEAIVNFIKDNAGVGVYDRDIAEQIEREAEACGRKGKSAAADGAFGDAEEEDDPMLDEAIKLAIEEKKISTSLIQRRLQLGYGRAAKLIDIMEARGIVSAPNGQKPRDVLISYDDYLEMSMRSD